MRVDQARLALRVDGCTEIVAPELPWRIAFRSELVDGSPEIVELHLSPVEGRTWSEVSLTDKKLSAMLEGLKVIADDAALGTTHSDLPASTAKRLTPKFDAIEGGMTPRKIGGQPVARSVIRQSARIVRESPNMEAAYAALQERFSCGRKNAENYVKQARAIGLPCDPVKPGKRKTS